jgi:hypothetical protein
MITTTSLIPRNGSASPWPGSSEIGLRQRHHHVESQQRAAPGLSDTQLEEVPALGLDILAKSRLIKITNQNPTDEEVTITAITA